MQRGSSMPEIVQRINFKEITEVQVTCSRCSTAIILPLRRCLRPSLHCPSCDLDLRVSSLDNHLGTMAGAILRIQEEAKQQEEAKLPQGGVYEFILRDTVRD